jgi:hypothetical protein
VASLFSFPAIHCGGKNSGDVLDSGSVLVEPEVPRLSQPVEAPNPLHLARGWMVRVVVKQTGPRERVDLATVA